MTLKQKVHAQFFELINKRISLLQETLADLKESGTNETKSTAGDKHETALAMLQIEQANTRGQLSIAMEQHAYLQNISPLALATSVAVGSLVKTNHGYFYLSIALGKITVDDFSIISLSNQSPLGAKLLGMGLGDTVKMNGLEYIIADIL